MIQNTLLQRNISQSSCQSSKFELAKMHQLEYVIITCNPDNYASRKTCEYAGGKLLKIVELPEDNDMRQKDETEKCVFKFLVLISINNNFEDL